LGTPGVENIPKFHEIETKLVKMSMQQAGLGYSFSLKVKWGYISAQKLESERFKSFAVSISLQSKIIRH